MFNILIAIALGLVVYAIVAVALHAIGAVIPATAVMLIALFLLTRRTAARVQEELKVLPHMLQQRKVTEAKQLLEDIKARYGRWQLFLGGQLEAQVGMIDYLQMKFDEALPRLQKGTFQNWSAWLAIGCIHWRRDRKAEAFEAFEKAAKAGNKEAIVWAIWAHLLVKSGERNEAVTVLTRALEALPESDFLKGLKNRVANKKKIDTRSFPQTYLQFWPEEFARAHVMRGRRGGPQHQAPQPRIGGRSAPRR